MLRKSIFSIRKRISQAILTRKNLKIIASYKSVPFIRSYSNTLLSPETHLGRNCSFNGLVVHGGGGKLVIGDNFHSGDGVIIFTNVHNFDKGKTIPYGSKYIPKDVIIEDNVWVGMNVIIMGGVHIGEGAVIQAGSVVVNDIPKYAIAGGHPAKVFKNRDIDHYEKLKREKKFH